MSWLDDLLGTQFSLGGTTFPRRQFTNFTSGVTIADNPGANRTDVTFDYDSHGAQLTADGIHTTLWKIYANVTDRRAQTLTAADVGKRGLQLDTAKIWDVVPSLSSPGTYTWGDNAGPEVSFPGDFGAHFASYSGLTVHEYLRGDLGVTGTTGTGKTSWANQTGAGSAITPGTSATNGIGAVGAGLNSKASIVTNGTNQFGVYTLPSTVTPGTINRHIVKVKRTLVTPSAVGYMDTTSGVTTSVSVPQTSPAANETIFNGGTGAVTTGVVINQWYACRYSWIGGLDQIRVGAHEPTPVSTTNNSLGTAWTFCGVNTASVSQEHLLYMVIDGPLSTFLTAYAAACPLIQSFWTSAIEI